MSLGYQIKHYRISADVCPLEESGYAGEILETRSFTTLSYSFIQKFN